MSLHRLLAMCLPLAVPSICLAQTSWPYNKPIAFSLTGQSPSIASFGSWPAATLRITPSSLLTPYDSTNGVVGVYNQPNVIGTSPLPVVESQIPGVIPVVGTAWPTRTELDGLSMISIQLGTYQGVTTFGGFQRWLQSAVQTTWLYSASNLPQTSLVPGSIYSAVCPNWQLPFSLTPYGPFLAVDDNGFDAGGSQVLSLGLKDSGQDDVDAIAWRFPPSASPNLTFYSVDSAAATQQGYSGATVFWYMPTLLQHYLQVNGQPFEPVNHSLSVGSFVYATPAQLGLTNADEVDGLIVFENTWTGYQSTNGTVSATTGWRVPGTTGGIGIYGITFPSATPGPITYQPDIIFFSIARKSASVGTLDASNYPIMPGDILMAPTGTSQTRPTIVIFAEQLGLKTDRLTFDSDLMDDLDALELFQY